MYFIIRIEYVCIRSCLPPMGGYISALKMVKGGYLSPVRHKAADPYGANP